MDIATGKMPNVKPKPNEGAVKRGGARAKALSAKLRREIAKKRGGIHRTPAMAAGVADHVWKVEEIAELLEASEKTGGPAAAHSLTSPLPTPHGGGCRFDAYFIVSRTAVVPRTMGRLPGPSVFLSWTPPCRGASLTEAAHLGGHAPAWEPIQSDSVWVHVAPTNVRFNADATSSQTTYLVDQEASQGERVPGAPIGTRGGLSVIHNFLADGRYTFQVGGFPTEGSAMHAGDRPEQVELTCPQEWYHILC